MFVNYDEYESNMLQWNVNDIQYTTSIAIVIAIAIVISEYKLTIWMNKHRILARCLFVYIYFMVLKLTRNSSKSK